MSSPNYKSPNYKSPNYKSLILKVDNQLFYDVVEYAEKERRSVNNTVEYILQRFFEEGK